METYVQFDNICRENQSIYFKFSNFSEDRVVCEIVRKNVIEPEGLQTANLIRRMRIACWINSTTRSEYDINAW